MSVLATLRQDRAGEWRTLDDYLRELRHRENAAVSALANALSASGGEQVELASHADAGAVLLEVACDLRLPKSSRLAATRCLLEAGIDPPYVGHLFVGAGDLLTDPRLGGDARKLVESGLPAALQLGGEIATISLMAGAFARAVQSAASAVGQARVKELLQGMPELHAGALAGLFALGLGELPEGHRTGWKRLLAQTCTAYRRAPAAAKRMGLVPAWPPNLPDAFGSLVKEAEEGSAGIESADAAVSPATLKKPSPPPPLARGRQMPEGPVTPAPPGKTLAPPIRRSPFRQAAAPPPPTVLPPKAMEPLAAQGPHAARPAPRPKVEQTTNLDPTRKTPLVAPPRKDLAFDARGARVPREDRWRDDAFEWAAPALPSSDLPPPPQAQVAAGPLASRIQSLFEDRPEAVDRLLGAAEALAGVRGEESFLRLLAEEAASKVWEGRTLPADQARRLQESARDAALPAPGRRAAELVLAKFRFVVSGRA
ncbi:MAG TPA: hypothetical protein VFE90_07445 [Myxococcales bacterium]|jgi:hypothetical protein|nr:hypothetical protein [Myxococcales bacterium]